MRIKNINALTSIHTYISGCYESRGNREPCICPIQVWNEAWRLIRPHLGSEWITKSDKKQKAKVRSLLKQMELGAGSPRELKLRTSIGISDYTGKTRTLYEPY